MALRTDRDYFKSSDSFFFFFNVPCETHQAQGHVEFGLKCIVESVYVLNSAGKIKQKILDKIPYCSTPQKLINIFWVSYVFVI